MTAGRRAALLLIVSVLSLPLGAQTLEALSAEFWQWRAAEQPFSADDIPRIERPANFAVDWSAATVRIRETQLAEFERRSRDVAPSPNASLAEMVDYRLLGSAIARVRWELFIEQAWRRDPQFYIDQTLGSVAVLLLPSPPFTGARQHEVVLALRQIPVTLRDAQTNLYDLRGPFAELAITALDDVGDRLRRAIEALAPQLTEQNRKEMLSAVPAAVTALDQYRTWLQARLPNAPSQTAIGRENYLFFLRNVALMPYTPEQLLDMSRQEWARSVAFEAYQQQRLANVAPAPIFSSTAAQIATQASGEPQIRAFLTSNHILTVPAWMPHYRYQALPEYLAPLAGVTEMDDFTGPLRLADPATRYIPPPSPSLGFFSKSMAEDPRIITVHEGVPGHYFQLALGWHHPDPIRRHYYDSGANEGIGFYAEEMLLQAGLFDDNPHTRQTIFNFMRLRALRVEVDAKLALGQFTLRQAADYLERTVPMDHQTAMAEAALFASTPGQAISYQIGKIQINELLADARRAQGDAFSLLRFHDFLWNNGNLPIALLRWELLGDPSLLPAPMPAATPENLGR